MNPKARPAIVSNLLIPAVVALLTAVTFLPSLQSEFVNWDDVNTLLNNPDYKGLGWTQLRWMFTTFYMGHYQPLTWVSWALDFLFWGDSPLGFHLTNVIFHTANAALFYIISRRLLQIAAPAPSRDTDNTLSVAAAFAALLFALHPLRVESVAWVTERRDVLSAHFLFWTIIFYLRATQEADSKRGSWMALSLVCYLFSLLSKASGMTLAAVLVILDIYPLRRLGGPWRAWVDAKSRSIYLEKLPYLVLGIIFGVTAIFAQEYSGALTDLETYPLPRRLAQSFYGLVFYLWKSLWPAGLSPLYQLYPRPNLFDPFDRPFVISAVVVLAITVALYLMRKRWPAGLAAWACYVVVLSPVLGLAQSGPQFVADRYTYLSCLSWALLAGAGWRKALRMIAVGSGKHERALLANGAAAFLLLVLAVVTWQQLRIWRDSESLWRRAVAINPESYRARIYLGGALFNLPMKKREAVQQYREALRIIPGSAEAHYKIAHALAAVGEYGEAVTHLRSYIEKVPGSASPHIELGIFLAQQGRTDEEIVEYRAALKLDPASVDAHYGLGNALARRGEFVDAKNHLMRAAELNPRRSDIFFSLGNLYVKENLLAQAVESFSQAVRVKPDYLTARNNLGRVFAAQGDMRRALEQFREALRIDPTYVPAHESLAQALADLGRKEEAMNHYREVVRLTQPSAGRGPQR
jgi:tetratricopeptide (TPR) repeat protein